MEIKVYAGEVWFVDFPYEEDPTHIVQRPVVVLGEIDNQGTLEVLSVKVTSKDSRDEYDVPIIKYTEAGLRLKSVARTSKAIILNKDYFIKKFGELDELDLKSIIEAYKRYLENN